VEDMVEFLVLARGTLRLAFYTNLRTIKRGTAGDSALVEIGSVRALPSFVILSVIFSAQLDDTMGSVCCADDDHEMDMMLENIMQILYFNIF
jgi:hypothetical protein